MFDCGFLSFSLLPLCVCVLCAQCVPSPSRDDLFLCRHRPSQSLPTSLAFVTRDGEILRTLAVPKGHASEPSWK
jgi:hypothetical protein